MENFTDFAAKESPEMTYSSSDVHSITTSFSITTLPSNVPPITSDSNSSTVQTLTHELRNNGSSVSSKDIDLFNASESVTTEASTLRLNNSGWSSSYGDRTWENSTLTHPPVAAFPPGAIAGIVVGGFVLVVIGVVLIVCLCKRYCRLHDMVGLTLPHTGNSYKVNDSIQTVKAKTPAKSTRRSIFGINVDDWGAAGRKNSTKSMVDTLDEPPPVPVRTSKASEGDSKTSNSELNEFSSTKSPGVSETSKRTTCADEQETDVLDCIPDGYAPPPPRDSCYFDY